MRRIYKAVWRDANENPDTITGLEDLYQRKIRRSGDFHADLLLKLAWQDGGGRMNPPEKLEEMFIYYDQIVQEYIKRGDLNKNDAIYPALIFKEQLTRAEEPRYLFVVPGKDPWPDPKRFKVMIETLHAYEAQIRLIMSKLYSPNRNARLATAQEFEQLRPVLQDRVARIEVALYHGVKLGITPAQIIHDSTPDYVSKGSKTYQFFESFAPPKSRTWAAFVSAWAAK